MIDIRVCCGCGVTYTDIQKALQHAIDRQHIMTVQGSINPKKEVAPSAH